jgi:hypothetical protein
VSTIALSWFLKKDNKKMEEAMAAGWTAEEGVVEGKVNVTAQHNEHPTAGMPLGGARTGALAKYDI